MNAGDGINREKCDWCQDTGLITVYHRQYRGEMTVLEEYVDSLGEIHNRRMPGIIAAHCDCNLGEWMHRNTDPKIRDRIPTLAQIIRGSGRYLLERQDVDDPGELTDEARAFVRRWKEEFGGRMLKSAPKGHKCEPEDVGRALYERARRLEAKGAIPS